MMTGAGIVTVDMWTMAANGEEYRYFWCSDWRVITDKQVPIEGFRSTEKWQLLAMNGPEMLAVIPGCQVKAWVSCQSKPSKRQIYNLGG
jgi:hypothetical protein